MTKNENNVIQLNAPVACHCASWPVSHQDRTGAHHHSVCSHYKSDKYPYLFAWHEEDEAWYLVPMDFLQFIAEGLEDQQAQTIKFMRTDLTDEEIFNECGL